MKLKNIIKIGSFVVAGALPTTSKAQVYMCQACPAGTYSDGTQTQCTPCPAGTYSNGSASECKACPAGKYSKSGSSECQTCGAGTYSTAGAGSCSSCSQPTYSGWSSGSCGVTATRTKTTYCNASGNTSATANPSNSTESKYNGDCPRCRVEGRCMCEKRGTSGQYMGTCSCSNTNSYANIGETITSKYSYHTVAGENLSYAYYYTVYYTNGGECSTGRWLKGCTCK